MGDLKLRIPNIKLVSSCGRPENNDQESLKPSGMEAYLDRTSIVHGVALKASTYTIGGVTILSELSDNLEPGVMRARFCKSTAQESRDRQSRGIFGKAHFNANRKSACAS